MADLPAGHGGKTTVMIDADYLKVDRTAVSLGDKNRSSEWPLVS